MGRAEVILLDTHVWVRWLAPESRPLADDVLASIDAADRLAVSAISCWEVVHLHKRGRIDLGMDVSRWLDLALEGSDVECLPITRDIAAQAAALSDIHRDPADRFIIGTAVLARCRLLTLDDTVRRYPEVHQLLA
jgi:PIN domain nuclease of toxin-antitoxin system